MTNEQIEEIQVMLRSNAWKLIEEMLMTELPDNIEGSYSDIAIHLLAKNKAKRHISEIINRLKNLQVDTPVSKEVFR